MKIDFGFITKLIDTIGKVYLRWTDPKRRIASLERKLKAIRDAQKKVISQSDTPRNRRKLAKLIHTATELRRKIEQLRK